MPPSSPSVLLTGAGSGIGRATALLLAQHGFRLALAGRNLHALHQTTAMFPAGAALPLLLSANISDPGRAQSMVDDAVAHFGRLDVLINNAGQALSRPIADHDPPSAQGAFSVNFFGPAAAISRAWPVFERQRAGCIINISSMSSIDPFPGLSIYGAAKAALNTLTKGCATEGAGFGLRAFSIAPGAVETPMLRALFDDAIVPPALALHPDAIADVILACIRGDHDARNGETILVPSP